jgi:hypothetical protein
MKCPRCRKWIAVEAIKCECGWRATTKVEVLGVGEGGGRRLTKEEAQVYIERMRAIVRDQTRAKLLKKE